MDTELLRLAKEVTDLLKIEISSKPLVGDFVKTKLRAELRVGGTTYVYSSDAGNDGYPLLRAMVKLKQYIANLEE